MCKSSFDKDDKGSVSNAHNSTTSTDQERKEDSRIDINMGERIETCKALVPVFATTLIKTDEPTETRHSHTEVKDSRVPSKADIQQTASRIGNFFVSALMAVKGTNLGEKIIDKVSEFSPTVERAVQQATLISDKKVLLSRANFLRVEIPNSALRENTLTAYETIQSRVFEASLAYFNEREPVSPRTQSLVEKFNEMRSSGELSNERSILGNQPLSDPNQLHAAFNAKMFSLDEAKVQDGIISSLEYIDSVVPRALEEGKVTQEEAHLLETTGAQYALDGHSFIETAEAVLSAINYLNIMKKVST